MQKSRFPSERDRRREHLRLTLGLLIVGTVTALAAFRGEPAAAAVFAVAGVRGTVILARGWPERKS